VKGGKMIDPRVTKFADVLVNFCVKLKKEQLVLIQGTELAAPLIKEVYKKATLVGAYPYTRIGIEGLDEIYFKYSSPEQLKFISPLRKMEIERVDALISIQSTYNSRTLSAIEPAKQAIVQKAGAGIMKKYMERAAKGELSWVGCLYPTLSSAQDANMSLSDYEDFVFAACKVDKKDPIAEWKKISIYNSRLIKYLKNKKVIRIVAKDTDLSYNIGGRTWINCDGSNNFPDGEVFTAPVENSANGHVRFTYPAIYSGREVDDVTVVFKDGKAVSAKAAKGEAFLNAMLDVDKGARYLGEVAIGTNFGINQHTKNILFDEKIGGTIHMAFGESYPESGGKNHSGIHWDMICELRQGGEMYADGELFFKNGKFLK
jgi:aminopeptidase